MVALAWLHPSGGLRYHLRAWRYRETVWKPYLDAIGAWLSSWTPGERALLLVGPSGGYSLPAEWLARFERITAVEPDPIARWIFRRRFRRAFGASRTAVTWRPGDYFTPRSHGGYSIARWNELLSLVPDHAVLFCNFLGQISLLDRRERHHASLAEWFDALPASLAGRSFASYHDRFSGVARPRVTAELTAHDVTTNEALGAQVYVSARQRREALDVFDHGTGTLFPGHARQFFAWQLVPGFWHLIEGVQHAEHAERSPLGLSTPPARPALPA